MTEMDLLSIGESAMAFDVEEILEINKFSHLHDSDRVFFCKTDYVDIALKEISKIPHEVIFISGNSDYTINEARFNCKPPNVVKWFCHNKHFDSDVLVPIPIGIENKTECKLGSEHGFIWDHAPEKHKVISEIENRSATKTIYANFTVDSSRCASRGVWRSIAENSEHITFEGNMRRPYIEFVSDILDHEAVLCPLGNTHVEEGDNHRIYEVLYLGRIPIVHTEDYYKKLHHKFPVLLVKNLDDIADEDFMKSEIKRIKNEKFDDKYLKFSYWKNLILKEKMGLR